MPTAASPSVPQKRKQPPARITASPAKKPSTPASTTKVRPNGNILSFFKKAEARYDGPKARGLVDPNFFIIDEDEPDIQLPDDSPTKSMESIQDDSVEDPVLPNDVADPKEDHEDVQAMVDAVDLDSKKVIEASPPDKTLECSPPPPDVASADIKPLDDTKTEVNDTSTGDFDTKLPSIIDNIVVKQDPDIPLDDACPFALEDETSDIGAIAKEDNDEQQPPKALQLSEVEIPIAVKTEPESELKPATEPDTVARTDSKATSKPPTPVRKSIFKTEPSMKDQIEDEDYIEDDMAEFMDDEQGENKWGDDEIEDPDDELGEETVNRKWMEENTFDGEEELEAALGDVQIVKTEASGTNSEDEVLCPICSVSMKGIKNDDATRHVNACLDGKPIPLPTPTKPTTTTMKMFKEPRKPIVRPERPPQASPFTSAAPTGAPDGSAFSKLMASHAEDRAWASAAQAEAAARGKRSFERTCPFYKILPNLSIAVDAFRYGAVAGANWCHGPIYCSKITANLCRRQLRVDPKWMMELEYEVKVEVPGTGGATVTMLDANHCPGSSLFLYEKDIPNGRGGKRKQRILHCGDFRAHAKHLRHPLLSVLNGNKIDICYLDTTYMNPKYAFPTQQQVIDVCAEMCVSMSKEIADSEDNFEKTRRDRGITSFLKNSDSPDKSSDGASEGKNRGKLLIVVGTYSIGKERICMGIAKALDCKIFAPPNKQKICAALENAELSARLTLDPYAGQVHMTPLMEIRAETLKDYLQGYKPHFSRIVGFRPSGWNYRPPSSRFIESPNVNTVLHSPAWRSDYHISQLYPQRGSCTEAKCFGVPYSEHSSFRELTTFCCGLDIIKIIPTVNVGSAKSREKMKVWFEKWAAEKKKNGFYKLEEGREIL